MSILLSKVEMRKRWQGVSDDAEGNSSSRNVAKLNFYLGISKGYLLGCLDVAAFVLGVALLPQIEDGRFRNLTIGDSRHNGPA